MLLYDFVKTANVYSCYPIYTHDIHVPTAMQLNLAIYVDCIWDYIFVIGILLHHISTNTNHCAGGLKLIIKKKNCFHISGRYECADVASTIDCQSSKSVDSSVFINGSPNTSNGYFWTMDLN